ncbi:sodium-dependent transporter [uncultured Oscillibacter sp.]|uniref:sodium-dependent transporter n=1 Tax=uncultured Oscillibacter sp. TaxID=876091 RepID=UPI0025DB8CE5|nr:sodium-dependent transporter [uncultured Oscillibacter sp.]
MENERGSWGSNLGFLLAAIGSAVGLGNIWGFPYKMGKSGGFAFLVVYVLLAIFVGFSIMMSELAMGRKTGKGTIGAYHALSTRFKWVGWLAVFSPFVILSFYTVLGGYCIEYMSLNLSNLAFAGAEIKTGADLFSAMLTNPFGCVMFTFLFMIICYLINRGGIAGGIEKFNNVGMPALFVMLVIIIIRSVTLPGAAEGLKFMFLPGYAVQAGFIESAPSFISVLATAGGQMFFSLSLAMGITITYGSYMKKEQNIVKNSVVVVFADTLVAIMAGIAVIPAAVATYGPSATLSGPKLLFITLQDVFQAMGAIGPLFGVIFYLFVLVAAISSAIALIEVVVTFLLDHAESKGKQGNRSKIVFWVCVAIMVEAALVAVDGLGSNGVWVPFQKMIGIGPWNDCWLDFMDALSEGLAMPAGALIMSIMIGWELRTKPITDEIHHGAEQIHWLNTFMDICLKFIVPIAMAFILGGQIGDFFTMDAETQGQSVYYIGYVIGAVILLASWLFAINSPKRKEPL